MNMMMMMEWLGDTFEILILFLFVVSGAGFDVSMPTATERMLGRIDSGGVLSGCVETLLLSSWNIYFDVPS